MCCCSAWTRVWEGAGTRACEEVVEVFEVLVIDGVVDGFVDVVVELVVDFVVVEGREARSFGGTMMIDVDDAVDLEIDCLDLGL